MTRYWHVEHADGSEWTIDDLEQWALDHPEENMIYCDMAGFMVDEYGGLSIVDECGNYCYVGQSPDMVVVRDGALRPCPICGSEDLAYSFVSPDESGGSIYEIRCKKCGHHGPRASSSHLIDLDELWNRDAFAVRTKRFGGLG